MEAGNKKPNYTRAQTRIEKNQILNELKEEMQEKFECLKKELIDKYDFPIVDDAMEDDQIEEDNMDIRGYGQNTK